MSTTEREGQIAAVERMQRYIEEHLFEPMTLKALAREAGYSPWYASRIFKSLLGKTPFEYIRSLRMSHAAQVLRQSNKTILDVALDFVFDSHEGFTRAFAREFGLSPSKYRARLPPLRAFMAPRLSQLNPQGVHNMSVNMQPIFVQVIERPHRKAIVKRGKQATHYFEYCAEVGCEVWNVLGQIKEALYEPVGMWLPDAFRPQGTSKYVQGVEVPLAFSCPVPDSFEVMELPACHLMVFQGPPFQDDEFEKAIAAVENLIERYEPAQYGFQWADDDGPRIQLEPWGYRGYIEARPVRATGKPALTASTLT